MPINMQQETVVSLTEATKILPPVNGKRPAISTMWRWCRKGLHGVRLEYIRVGRSIATSREAINRFFEALAQADKPLNSGPVLRASCRTPTALRRASLEAADRAMERLGVRTTAVPTGEQA